MFEVIIFSLITNLMFFSYGNLIKFEEHSNNINSINDRSIIGCILCSFIALVVNFFLPLNLFFNSIVLIFGIGIFFYLNYKKVNKKLIYYLLLSSIITSSLILFSNVNRPDAGLYHLPFTNVLNEHKIIFGLSNIHFRFGTASIMQYLSAINYNFIFKDIGITIPLASIVTFFFIYFFNTVFRLSKNLKNITNENIFCLFIIIFISYKINRYSSFGNDAVGHLTLFYLTSKVLNEKKINLSFVTLIAVFAFLNKTTMIFVLLFPILFFFKYYNLKNLKIVYSFSSLIFFLWLIKNIIISGCLIYPVKQTCFEKLKWTDIEEIKIENIYGEAWSKDWPNRIDKNISVENFIKEFNWLNTWSSNHGIKLLKILLIYLFFVFILILFLQRKNCKNKYYYNNKNNLNILLTISIFGSLIFLIKFPLFRYGYSYLITFIILITLYFIKKINYLNLKIVSKYTFVICVALLIGKQAQRYAINYKSDFIWPRIYSFDTNKKILNDKITLSNEFTIFLSKTLCMYDESPCTNYKLKENLYVKKKAGYYFLNLKNY